MHSLMGRCPLRPWAALVAAVAAVAACLASAAARLLLRGGV